MSVESSWVVNEKPQPAVREVRFEAKSGLGAMTVFLLLLLLGGVALIAGAATKVPILIVVAILAVLAGIIGLSGLFIVNPNEAKVLQLFGDYKGTTHEPGLRWTNPFMSKQAVSLRVRNFESEKLKVNDLSGNPIEIAAVVVWKVVDTAEALFQVDHYENFVKVQSEAALRNLASSYPYDAHVEGETSLRSHTGEVAEHLRSEIQERLNKAGVEVIEARISHLAYAPEIAGAMLQRQQASAIIAARQKIVEGAVGMVEMALEMLQHQNVVVLDNEKKAEMVSNLLVVLCSDRAATPVLNTSSRNGHPA